MLMILFRPGRVHTRCQMLYVPVDTWTAVRLFGWLVQQR